MDGDDETYTVGDLRRALSGFADDQPLNFLYEARCCSATTPESIQIESAADNGYVYPTPLVIIDLG